MSSSTSSARSSARARVAPTHMATGSPTNRTLSRARGGNAESLNPGIASRHSGATTPVRSPATKTAPSRPAGFAIPRMRPWARGLRRNATSCIPGIAISPTYRPRPLMKRASSLRSTRAPIPSPCFASSAMVTPSADPAHPQALLRARLTVRRRDSSHTKNLSSTILAHPEQHSSIMRCSIFAHRRDREMEIAQSAFTARYCEISLGPKKHHNSIEFSLSRIEGRSRTRLHRTRVDRRVCPRTRIAVGRVVARCDWCAASSECLGAAWTPGGRGWSPGPWAGTGPADDGSYDVRSTARRRQRKVRRARLAPWRGEGSSDAAQKSQEDAPIFFRQGLERLVGDPEAISTATSTTRRPRSDRLTVLDRRSFSLTRMSSRPPSRRRSTTPLIVAASRKISWPSSLWAQGPCL